MEPFKVTIYLDTPIGLDNDNPSHLDGLISAAKGEYYDRYFAEEGIDIFQEAIDLTDIVDKQVYDDGQWVWKASILTPTYADNMKWMTMTKKSDTEEWYEDMHLKRTQEFSIIIGSGPYKEFCLQIPYRSVEKIEAWVVGDADELEKYLSTSLLPSIGKYRKNGFGVVREITLERDETAHEKWKLRSLPLIADQYEGHSYHMSETTIAPPYWRKTDRILAKIPKFG